MDISQLIAGAIAGGVGVEIVKSILNRGTTKASIYKTMQDTTTAHIKELKDEIERQKGIIADEKRDKKETMEKYLECIAAKEVLQREKHNLELELLRCKNTLIKENIQDKSNNY